MHEWMHRQADTQSERQTNLRKNGQTSKSQKLKDNFEKLVQLKLGIGIPFSKMLD